MNDVNFDTTESRAARATPKQPSAQFKAIKLQNSPKGVEARHGSADRIYCCRPTSHRLQWHRNGFIVSYPAPIHSSSHDGFMFSLREPIPATWYPSSAGCVIEPAIVHHVCCLHSVVEISQYSLHFVCLLRSCPPKMYLGTLLYELVAVSCPAFYCMCLKKQNRK